MKLTLSTQNNRDLKLIPERTSTCENPYLSLQEGVSGWVFISPNPFEELPRNTPQEKRWYRELLWTLGGEFFYLATHRRMFKSKQQALNAFNKVQNINQFKSKFQKNPPPSKQWKVDTKYIVKDYPFQIVRSENQSWQIIWFKFACKNNKNSRVFARDDKIKKFQLSPQVSSSFQMIFADTTFATLKEAKQAIGEFIEYWETNSPLAELEDS